MRQLFFVLVLAGCAGVPKTAIVDGRPVPRLTLEFNGQPFNVQHQGAHPRPGGPSSGLKDDGGAIHGRVCGMFVDYDVHHEGDHVQLVGSIDNHIPTEVQVRDVNGERVFSGSIGGQGIDLKLAGDHLIGTVGRRVFALESAEDRLQGFMRATNFLRGAMPILIKGKDTLWSLPAADQAAVLPNLLTCVVATSQNRHLLRNEETLELGFGGDATDRPDQTSSIYTHSR